MNYREAIQKTYQDVEMPGGWKWNHMKNLRKIDLFYNSQFETGNYDDQGFWKFFYNISKTPCDVASKFIDIDVQNIRFLPRPSMGTGVTDNELCAYFMTKDFNVYADEEDLGQLINQWGDDLPKYGDIYAKNVKGSPMRVAPHNIRFDPSVQSLKKSPFVAEPYILTKNEILKKKWNNLKNFEKMLARGDSDAYLIYEFYENTGEKKWKRTIVGDVFCWRDNKGGIVRSLESSINYQGEELPAVVLHEDAVELPYKHLKWEHVDGRLPGLGYVEYLFPNQIATNEAENLERKNLYFTSLILLQTRSADMAGKNVLTQSNTGDVFIVDSEITRVPMEERNLAAYNATRERWDANTVRKTFTTDVATGGNLPSRTPLGVANLQAGMVTSFYDKKRENFGMFLKDEIIEDIAIPSFKEKTAKEHILTIGSSEKDIEEYEKHLTRIFVEKAVADYAEKNGYYPSMEQRKFVESQVLRQLKSQKNKYAKITDFYYENAEYKIEIDVTGESVDTGIRSQLLQTAMQMLPVVQQNPALVDALVRFLALGGISPNEVGLDTEAIKSMPMGVPSGSVASPSAPMSNMMPQTKTM